MPDSSTRRALILAVIGLGSVLPALALAQEEPSPLLHEKPSHGRPTVVLDQLNFPADVSGAKSLQAHLRKVLKREARKADWGAGAENRIEYRVTIKELTFHLDKGALTVSCTALGMLPGGRAAQSALTYSGSASARKQVTEKVLEIVARGLITRLSEVERRRRGLR